MRLVEDTSHTLCELHDTDPVAVVSSPTCGLDTI